MIVDSVIDLINITTGSNSITLRKRYVRSHGYDKMYIDKDLIHCKLFEYTDQFSEKEIVIGVFISRYLHLFYDGNGTCKILFVDNFNWRS